MSTPTPSGRRDDAGPVGAVEPAAGTPAIDPGPPRPPARGSSFTWLLGLVCIVGLAYITLNTLRTGSPGSRGVSVGKPMPPFAVPLASSRRRCAGGPCDANVARRDDSGVEGRAAACSVRAPDILNSCELAERGPVALAFVATPSKRCEEQVDVMQRLRSGFRKVEFAAVAIRGDQADLRREVRARGWTLPVGYDHDGAVSNAYAVAVCPTITFARRGGTVAHTSLRFLDERALAAQLRAIGG